MGTEKRAASAPAEVASSETGVRVSGYAAVFNQETSIGGYWREVIAPGAFTRAIGQDDVVLLINHEGLPLARTRSGTLSLSEDDHGLKVETTLDPDDPDVATIVPKMKRGDLDKMSFSFRATVQEWDESQSPPLRTIREVELYDVAIVTTPAYDGTEIALRSRDEARQRSHNHSAAATRIRMKKNLADRLARR
jgi:HK97 family phage prohead protease